MKTNEFIRKQIRSLREKAGFSQSEMAVQLHMDERNYKRIESGEKKTFDIDLLDKLATVLNVSIPDLITETGSTMTTEEMREHYQRIIAEQRQIIDSARKVQDDLYNLLFDKIKQQNAKQE
jgi:transcriptional regulator with XRE-family HTH domain